MQQLEQWLDEWLVTKAPFQLPENFRKGIVTALPWLALVGGILVAWSAWQMWQLAIFVDAWWGLDPAFHIAGSVPFLWLWLSLGVFVLQAVLLFAAFPALREQQRKGWKLLFLVAIINVVHAVLQAVTYTNLPSLVAALIVTLIGLYLLFQVRPYYTDKKAPRKSDTAATPKETPAKRTKKKK